MDSEQVLENVREIAAEWAAARSERQKRRHLDRADFDRLRDAGFLLTGAPVEQGGLWDGVARSTRPYCEILRALARGDSSVALVSSMHPAVLVFWLATPEAEAPFAEAWKAQRQHVAQTALDGAWWGTITSERRRRSRDPTATATG
jgi:alkylation response protein AidB-like acyl-CoA dehydrogenase